MNFCSSCGAQLEPGARFCKACGAAVSEVPSANVYIAQPAPMPMSADAPIDLRGNVSSTAPQEKKYKPLMWAGILCIPVLLLMIGAGMLFHTQVMEYSREKIIFGLLIVALPFILASIPFYLGAKAKHIASGSQRKMAKGTVVLLYVLCILTVSTAMVCGFSSAFTVAGFMGIFTFIMFIAMSIILAVYCNALSNQSGSEAYLCFAKAILVSFILAAPVGYLLGLLLALLERIMLIFIILIIAFFLFGGRIIFINRR